MAHSNTIINQIASFFPRHEFEKLAKIYHSGQKFRSYSRWSQFLAMTMAQITGRKSIRDLTSNLKVQGHRLYHLGMRQTTKTTLARVNEQQSYRLYREMFYILLAKCRRFAPKHKFKIEGKVYLLDTTTINLCLSVFQWAKFRQSKGAMKLHFGLDADGYLPVFMNMTDGKTHEVEWAKKLTLHPGACVVFDRGFTDYSWYQKLSDKNITLITRLKRNAITYRFGNRRPVKDDAIQLTTAKWWSKKQDHFSLWTTRAKKMIDEYIRISAGACSRDRFLNVLKEKLKMDEKLRRVGLV